MHITFLISASGCLIGYRSLAQLKAHGVISAPTFVRTKHILIFSMILLGLLMANQPLVLAILILGMQVLPLLLSILLPWQERKRFEQGIILVVDQIILKMRAGQSLREAFRSLKHLSIVQKSTELAKLFDSIEQNGASQNRPTTKEAVFIEQEVLEIQKLNTRTLDRVILIRNFLKTRRLFRQKAGRAKDLVRAQALVMVCIFILFTFILHQFSYLDLGSPLFLISCGLFVCGLGGIRYIERSFRWRT